MPNDNDGGLLTHVLNARDAANAQRAEHIVPFVELAALVGATWTLGIATADQLTAALTALGPSSRFMPLRAARILGPMVGDMMGVTVESSGPAITFTLPWYTQQRLGDRVTGEHRRYAVEEQRALAQRVIDAGKALHADEIRVTQYEHGAGIVGETHNQPGDAPYKVRLWWD